MLSLTSSRCLRSRTTHIAVRSLTASFPRSLDSPPKSDPEPSATPQSLFPREPPRSDRILVADLQNGLDRLNNAERVWRQRDDAFDRKFSPPPGPYAGRSVKVLNHDVAAAYRTLASLLARNNVFRELRLTERHEKPTDKRRRLNSERHRTRFAEFVSQFDPPGYFPVMIISLIFALCFIQIKKKVQLVWEIRRRGA
jgi:ribosomal protein S21